MWNCLPWFNSKLTARNAHIPLSLFAGTTRGTRLGAWCLSDYLSFSVNPPNAGHDAKAWRQTILRPVTLPCGALTSTVW